MRAYALFGRRPCRLRYLVCDMRAALGPSCCESASQRGYRSCGLVGDETVVHYYWDLLRK